MRGCGGDDGKKKDTESSATAGSNSVQEQKGQGCRNLKHAIKARSKFCHISTLVIFCFKILVNFSDGQHGLG